MTCPQISRAVGGLDVTSSRTEEGGREKEREKTEGETTPAPVLTEEGHEGRHH